MGRQARQQRLYVANDNGCSDRRVRITFRTVDDNVNRTVAEVFLQLLDGALPAANDN
jgi:hypothetical protein